MIIKRTTEKIRNPTRSDTIKLQKHFGRRARHNEIVRCARTMWERVYPRARPINQHIHHVLLSFNHKRLNADFILPRPARVRQGRQGHDFNRKISISLRQKESRVSIFLFVSFGSWLLVLFFGLRFKVQGSFRYPFGSLRLENQIL